MFFLSLRSDFNDESFMVKLPFISFLEYMHDFVCAMHVTAREFASLWRSSESIAWGSFPTRDNVLIIINNKLPAFQRDASDRRNGKPSSKKCTCVAFVTQATCEGI